MKLMVWDPDACDEEDATAITDSLPWGTDMDYEHAARKAVEQWRRDGMYSGDPFPDCGIDVNVRAPDGSLYQVPVYIEYEPVFSAGRPKKIG